MDERIWIVIIILYIIAIVAIRNKSMNKFFINIAWNKVITNLTEQGITNLKKDLNEEEIISRVREYYKDNFNYENLNLTLIKLENLKLGRSKFMISNFNALLVSLLLGIIGWVISLSSNNNTMNFDKRWIVYVSFFLLIMVGVGGYEDLFLIGRNSRLEVSVNIHKSIRKINIKSRWNYKYEL